MRLFRNGIFPCIAWEDILRGILQHFVDLKVVCWGNLHLVCMGITKHSPQGIAGGF